MRVVLIGIVIVLVVPFALRIADRWSNPPTCCPPPTDSRCWLATRTCAFDGQAELIGLFNKDLLLDATRRRLQVEDEEEAQLAS